MTLADYLKKYRSENDISQRELAKKCEISNSLISLIEQGRQMELSIRNYKALAKGTGVTLHQLFEILGPDAPVEIENPPILSLPTDLVVDFHPSVMAMIEQRANMPQLSAEDTQMWSLWRKASPTARRAIIAALKSIEGDD